MGPRRVKFTVMMRTQLLLITTILVVGTAAASTYSFYISPNKNYALNGEVASKRNTAVSPSQSQVAGIAVNRMAEDFPGDIPIFTPSEVGSYSKNVGSQQLTLKTSKSLVEVIEFYSEIMVLNGWAQDLGHYREGIQTLVFSQNERKLVIKIFSSPETEETNIKIFFSDTAVSLEN
jgi:hypothetical protein